MNNSKKTIAAGGFILKDDQLLLLLRQNASCDNGMYCIPGGRVEEGESVHGAAVREIFEETGLKVDQKDMELAHVISFKKEDGSELISFDFIIRRWQGEPINKEPKKFASVDWFPLSQLPSNFIERHKNAYLDYKNGVYYSSFGY